MIARLSEHAVPVAEFASDVHYYLSLQPRQLPSRYFYDELGSALFDAICRLPWYPITRAETRLLAGHGRAIFARAGGVSTIVELGPGSGEKLAALVVAGRAASARPPHLDLRLVDISASALELASRTLAPIPDVSITTYEARYETGLLQASREARGRQLVLFLGSNIGNFDRPGADAFLRGVRAGVAAGDMLLVGADLVKSEQTLRLAYDDPLGVTAAFNRNLLVRINRELGGTFDVDGFSHRAAWAETESRVEMHLVSRRRQHVRVDAAGIDCVFEEGESIWTESSYKYTPAGIALSLERAGFNPIEQWQDDVDGFALTLAEAR